MSDHATAPRSRRAVASLRCLAAATLATVTLAACSSGSPTAQPSATAGSTSAAPSLTPSTPAATPSGPSSASTADTPGAPHVAVSAPPVRVPSSTVATRPTSSAPSKTQQHKGSALPLGYSTGNATQVVTVTASSRSRTTATLQAWTKAAGGGWSTSGPAITAWLGSNGMTSDEHEGKSSTPMGSYTLTRAFGALSDPGTTLPYTRTNPSYWWISEVDNPLYNTMQSCTAHCSFTQGSPNEHLYYETPSYNYAVVIDYNTRNAGKVVAGAGSAFFLHVSHDSPTAGCVAIPQSRLVTLMRWLKPADHPRILIGTD